MHREWRGAAARRDGKGRGSRLADGGDGVLRLSGDRRCRVDRQGSSVAGSRDVAGVGNDHAVFGRASGGKAAESQGGRGGAGNAGAIAEISEGGTIVRGNLPLVGQRCGAFAGGNRQRNGSRLAGRGRGIQRLHGDRGSLAELEYRAETVGAARVGRAEEIAAAIRVQIADGDCSVGIVEGGEDGNGVTPLH